MRHGTKSFITMSPSQKLVWRVNLATADATNKIHAHLVHQDRQESQVFLVRMAQMVARVNLDHQLLHTLKYNHLDHADSVHLATKVHLVNLVSLEVLVPKVHLDPKVQMVNLAFPVCQHHLVNLAQQARLDVLDQRESLVQTLMLVARDQTDHQDLMVNLDRLGHQQDLDQLANLEILEALVQMDRLDNLADLETEALLVAVETRATLVQMPTTVLAHEEVEHKPFDQQNQNRTLDNHTLTILLLLLVLDFNSTCLLFCTVMKTNSSTSSETISVWILTRIE